MVRFQIPGKPQPWTRTGGHGAQRYTAPKTRQHKRLISQIGALHFRGRLLSGPLRLEVCAVFERPKSRPSCIDAATWATGAACWRPSTPDGDNIAKAVMDALNGIAWTDDAVVCELVSRKRYAAQGEAAHTEVTVSTLGAEVPRA